MPLATTATAAAVLMGLLTATGADEPVRLTTVPKGGMLKIGYYMPQRLELSAERPRTLTKAPEGVSAAAMYGVLPMAGEGRVFHVVVDEPEGGSARLWVDTNGNGDLTDDAAAAWDGREAGKDGERALMMYNGGAMVDLGDAGGPHEVHVAMYRFDKADPRRAELKNVLLYYRDYVTEGEVTINGKSYKVLLNDERASGDFRGVELDAEGGEQRKDSGVEMLIDVNGNGTFDDRGENFDVRAPFNIGGTSYKIADMNRTGTSFRIVKSDVEVAEIPTPPDHSVGQTITAFEAKTTDGKTLRFPGDYKGKVVLLDFWATWCGPCMHEMPNVVKAYAEQHENGFEVLGVSLDSEQTLGKMPEVMEKASMTWPQIADGKGWGAELAELYVVRSIPATYLVDGDTGKVLGVNLRGERLLTEVEKALEAKGAK